MIVIAGAPGCGKSTQVELLTKLGYQAVSASRVLRQNASEKVLAQMARGELVDIDYTNQLIGRALDKLSAEFGYGRIVLDGFPRALAQAVWLLETYPAKLTTYVLLEASRATLKTRLGQRQRADDHPDAIDRRLDLFTQNTQPLLDYLTNQQIVVLRISAEQSVAAIAAEIRTKLELNQTSGV